MDFTESSLFGNSEDSYLPRYAGEKRNTPDEVPFRQKLENWLSQAKETKELYGDDGRGYDPNDYSVDEWEAYLLKKNSSLTYPAFIHRQRWNMPIFEIPKRKFASSFKERLENAKALTAGGIINTDERSRDKKGADERNKNRVAVGEFLTDEEYSYALNWIIEVDRLRKEYSQAKTVWVDACTQNALAGKGDSNKELQEVCRDIDKQLHFSAKWKWIPEAPAPESVKDAVSSAIMKELKYKKRLWEWAQSRKRSEEPEAWNPAKTRLYNVAVEYGVLNAKQQAEIMKSQ